jgi:hypothetical protein
LPCEYSSGRCDASKKPWSTSSLETSSASGAGSGLVIGSSVIAPSIRLYISSCQPASPVKVPVSWPVRTTTSPWLGNTVTHWPKRPAYW